MALPNDDMLGELTSLEAGDEPSASAPQATGEEAKTEANYTGPDQRCASCVHFDGASKCDKWQFSVESDGHCDSWEAAGEASEPAAEEAGEENDSAYLPELEELE